MTQATIIITNTVTEQKAQFPLPFDPMSLSKIGVDETKKVSLKTYAYQKNV
ncbi:hypothetical protein [Streptococcus gordonii]|jgi:hypothetical protein|uniref:hypothetical protein n=1 Tax=Streptococcus gordonii TaxID=1302 RepID=UPI0022865928|nr:hypothetical protein [Streptococcus gordonii]WAM20743.1 hypothetical protein OFA61_08750 [Streptococcus gordonii]